MVSTVTQLESSIARLYEFANRLENYCDCLVGGRPKDVAKISDRQEPPVYERLAACIGSLDRIADLLNDELSRIL